MQANLSKPRISETQLSIEHIEMLLNVLAVNINTEWFVTIAYYN